MGKTTYAGTWAKNAVGGGRNCGILRYYVYGVSVPSLLIESRSAGDSDLDA